MPIENLEDEGLAKNPNLELAQWKFVLSTAGHENDSEIRSELMKSIEADDMTPFYLEVCNDLGWKTDDALVSRMKAANEAEIQRLNEAVEDAEKNLGDTEVREFMLKIGEYYSKIGDKEKALKQFRLTLEKTLTLGFRLDVLFHLIRIGIFYMDNDLIEVNIEKAQILIEEGGDWDRRNRLKVYKGMYKMAVRDFKTAANLYLDTIATFTSYELMDYKQFVTFTVLCSTIALDRPELREKVCKGSEILEVLHGLPEVKDYLFSLYDCKYTDFFKRLAQVEQFMKGYRLLAPHYRYYSREMRIHAYTQLLDSYSSLTLDYMARAFGVTTTFIDQELSHFIAAGRLHCKIDKVGGIVETNRPDSKNYQYQASIKQGDLLLNRVQKLSRVINI